MYYWYMYFHSSFKRKSAIYDNVLFLLKHTPAILCDCWQHATRRKVNSLEVTSLYHNQLSYVIVERWKVNSLYVISPYHNLDLSDMTLAHLWHCTKTWSHFTRMTIMVLCSWSQSQLSHHKIKTWPWLHVHSIAF